MTKQIKYVSLIWLGISTGFTAHGASALGASEILSASDQIRGGGLPGVEWDLTITATDADTGGDIRKFVVKATGDQSLAETTFPPRAAGSKLLQRSRNMWYGRPNLHRPISISSRQKMTGPAANGDIASTNYNQDYNAVLLPDDTIEGEPSYVLQLAAKNKWVTYDRIKYWVSKSRLVPLKAEFYTVSGKLFKTASFESKNELLYQGKRQPFVSRMVIRDTLNPDNVSVLDYSDVKLRQYSAADFSVDGLTQ